MKSLAAISMVALLLAAGMAQADPILDFGTASQSGAGNISYAGGSGGVVGTGINVQSVTGTSTATNSGEVFSISGGTLSFTTGSFSSSSAGSWSFHGGGSFSITGGISSLGVSSGSNLLFNGTFTGPVTVTEAGGNLKILGSAVMTDVNPSLTANYGISGNISWVGALSINFVASGTPPGSFSSTEIGSGDTTVSPPAAVPEPSSLALLGLGSLLSATFGWRMRRRAIGQG